MFTKIKKFLKEWGVLSFPSSKGIVIPREYVDKTSGKLIQNIETVLNRIKMLLWISFVNLYNLYYQNYQIA